MICTNRRTLLHGEPLGTFRVGERLHYGHSIEDPIISHIVEVRPGEIVVEDVVIEFEGLVRNGN